MLLHRRSAFGLALLRVALGWLCAPAQLSRFLVGVEPDFACPVEKDLLALQNCSACRSRRCRPGCVRL